MNLTEEKAKEVLAGFDTIIDSISEFMNYRSELNFLKVKENIKNVRSLIENNIQVCSYCAANFSYAYSNEKAFYNSYTGSYHCSTDCSENHAAIKTYNSITHFKRIDGALLLNAVTPRTGLMTFEPSELRLFASFVHNRKDTEDATKLYKLFHLFKKQYGIYLKLKGDEHIQSESEFLTNCSLYLENV